MAARKQTSSADSRNLLEVVERVKRARRAIRPVRKEDDVVARIRQILKREFPDDTVDVTLSGIRDNIHVLVMSRKLDRIKSYKRDEYIWSLLDNSDLTDPEKNRISLVLALSPDDVR